MIGFDPERPPCSRAGCRSEAAWSIVWRNPKIHAEDRRKVWLACDEHVAYLRDFLGSRGFPLEVTAGVSGEGAGAGS